MGEEEIIKIDGKYSIRIINKIENGKPNLTIDALRYGEKWRDCIGDNLIFAMAYKIQDLQTDVDYLYKLVLDYQNDNKK